MFASINLPEPTTPDEENFQNMLKKNPILESGIEQFNKNNKRIKTCQKIESKIINGDNSLEIQKKILRLEKKWEAEKQQTERVIKKLEQHNTEVERILKICAPLEENYPATPATIEKVTRELETFIAGLMNKSQENFSTSSS